MNVALTVFGIVLVLGGIALCAVVTGIKNHNYTQHNTHYEFEGPHDSKVESSEPKPKVAKAYILIAVLGIILIIFSYSFCVIPSGYTGVRTTFGLIDQESCMPGFNWLAPFAQKVNLVNNKQQDIRFDECIWCETSEQVTVYMEGVQVTYNIVPESSAWIYAHVENWVEELVDSNLVASALKSASRELDTKNIADRPQIQSLSKMWLQTIADEKYGENRIEVKNILISNIDFLEEYTAAIEAKNRAVQEQEQQAIQNKTDIDKAIAEGEATKARAEAEAIAEKTRANAESEAEKIRAQGKADANKIIIASITDITQRQDIIDKWNGQLPRYIGNDSSISIIDEFVEH